jgi:hypothetical protein
LTITVGATGPDLSIQSTKAWSLKLAGVVPEAGFDQYAERRVPGANLLDPATDLRYWPLFCLHAIDTDDYIEFRAACVYQAGLGGAELGFQIRKVVSGVTTTVNFGNGRQLWIPGSPLFVAIGFDGGNLHAGATLGAGAVETVTGGIDVSDWLARTPAVKFKAIRFRAGSAAEEPGEVVDFRWVGGEFSDAALTDGTIPGAFTSLDFAKGP